VVLQMTNDNNYLQQSIYSTILQFTNVINVICPFCNRHVRHKCTMMMMMYTCSQQSTSLLAT